MNFNPEDGGSIILQNSDTQPPQYVAWHPRKPCILSSPPWKSQISHKSL